MSRACNEFLIELLKLEVPEINEGLLEIKNVAREPGQRAKIAVQVKDKRIDPIGTCVGVKGSRVQNVTKELNNERIDIVRWSDQPVEYVVSALAPATVTSVVVHADAGKMDVVVDQENKKGAVGASGQNVKLASKLTGWDINVMTAEEAAEEKEKEIGEIRSKLMQYLEVDEEVAEALIENGIDTLENLAYGPEDELFAMEDFDEDTIRELRSRARTGLITQALEREELLKTADPKLLELPGMEHDLVALLSKKGVKTLDDLADLSTAELVEMTNMEEQDAQKLIVAARAHWDN
ncbi:transcription termination/antitermination protein NusA [Turicimonas muris]|uniref:transcription termination/antitermination protein NusA n=1 Tax=Turicimonas muris TaxID=1796652 RepID=UPI003F4A350F